MPRPTKSPPPQRPSTSPAPQRPKATPKKNKVKAKDGSAADAAPAAAEPLEEPDAVAGEASSSKAPAEAAKGAAAPAAAPVPAPAPAAPASGVSSLVVAVIVLVLALAGGTYVGMDLDKPKKLTKLSPKSFDGTTLKLSGGYTGVALVAFLNKYDCWECKKLKKVLEATNRQNMLERLQGAESLRIGKVYCDTGDEYDALCTNFGVTGDDPEAAGPPQLFAFRNGTFVKDPYADKEFTPGAIKAWAAVVAAGVAADPYEAAN